MKIKLPLFIAKRYLFSKKSHNVISIISIVSSCAIGVGCMALIVILSVLNGFDEIIVSLYNSHTPDFVIYPKSGKSLKTDAENIIKLEEYCKEKYLFFTVIEDNVYVQYNDVQSITKLKGVPYGYTSLSQFNASLESGELSLQSESTIPNAIVGKKLHRDLNIEVSTVVATDSIESNSSDIHSQNLLSIYYPSRFDDISISMPMESVLSEDVSVVGVADMGRAEEYDMVVVSDSLARTLMEYEENQANYIELFLEPTESSSKINSFSAIMSKSYKKVEKELTKILLSSDKTSDNQEVVLRNRVQQNPTMYKMMRSEKLAVFLILFFVIVIVAVNILSSLSMLIIDKKSDIETYKSMGATLPLIRKSFIFHGWFTSLIGAVLGLFIGVIVCLIQKQYALISLPGNFVQTSYPVRVSVIDIILVLFSTALIGFVMSYIPSRTIK